jgi:hypothetical protein
LRAEQDVKNHHQLQRSRASMGREKRTSPSNSTGIKKDPRLTSGLSSN